jgi:hypothetical protein
LLCSFVVLSNLNDVNDVKFRAIRDDLAKKSTRYKRTWSLQTFANVLPFTQIDRKTALPIVEKVKEESFSQESVLKLAAYKTSLMSVGGDTDSVVASVMPWIGNPKFTKNFDKMVTEKGVESLLAVIYIDGNELGERVKNLIPEDISLDEGVNRMRRFTREINDVFVRRPLDKIIGAELELMKLAKESDETDVIALRQIVGAGDEITLVCNARKALDIVNLYFDSLSETNAKYRRGCNPGEDYSNYSACAGITLFHSHAPFTVAYEIAEKCCENGKKRRRTLLKNADVSICEGVKDNCYLDFFFMMSGVTDELDDIRSQQYCNCTNVPYCITGNDSERTFETFDAMEKQMVKAGRANVGALQSAALQGETELSVEIERIRSKISGFLQKEIEKEDMPQIRKIVHDVATVYDVWFRGEEA